MEAYKERFKKEYAELKEKHEKLNNIIMKAEQGELDFELSCPLELLKRQAGTMSMYEFILEERAAYEHIIL